jgi:hypothetical protein
VIEPKFLTVTELIGATKKRVAVRHIVVFYASNVNDGTHIQLSAGSIDCRESVETIEAWIAGRPTPTPAAAPVRVKTSYPIESLYGRPAQAVFQTLLRYDPTATGVEGPGRGEITVECEERHRAVIDELFKPPPGATPKPLDGEKSGS